MKGPITDAAKKAMIDSISDHGKLTVGFRRVSDNWFEVCGYNGAEVVAILHEGPMEIGGELVVRGATVEIDFF